MYISKKLKKKLSHLCNYSIGRRVSEEEEKKRYKFINK